MARKGTIKNMGKVKNEMSDAWKARKAAKTAPPATASAKTERLRKAVVAEIQERIETMPAADAAPAKAPKAPKAPKEPKAKKVSCLDAAARVLAEAKQPMRPADMLTTMEAAGYWKRGAGKTPEASLYAAIIREIRDKGADARFTKTDRGTFAAGKIGGADDANH